MNDSNNLTATMPTEVGITDGVTEMMQTAVEELKSEFIRRLPDVNIIAAAQWMNLILIPIISIVGLTGNISSALIMMSQEFRQRSTAVYFTALAIADSLCILDRVIFEWLFVWVLKYTQRQQPDALCMFGRNFSFVSLILAAWFIVAVTMERFLVTLFPFQAARLCSGKGCKDNGSRYRCFYWYLWTGFVWSHGVDSGSCDTRDMNKTLNLWGRMLLASLYSYIPNATLLVLNTAIAGMLIWHSRKVKKMTGEENKSAYRATRTTLTVSVVSLLLTSPTPVGDVFLRSAEEQLGKELLMLLKYIFRILSLLNNSINFFIYVLMSSSFRAKFLSYFRRSQGTSGPVELSDKI